MSKLRLNSLQNPDSSAVNIELTSTGGAVVSGILTASTIDGGTITATNITSTDLTVEGTITYDDVTNVDSVGVITARNGIDVNAGGIDVNAGGINAVGIVTATSFSGEDYLLSAIDTSITDTAVDIFVYDTSKDSDGGAWRKRTQHTSWYNETLNTAIRGSRKEFPAVAVIVAETDTLTIYDGDDPDLPMWMVFTSGDAPGYTGPHINIASGSTLSAVAALNGEIVVTCNSGTYPFGSLQINFLKDRSLIRPDVGGKYSITGIAKRNQTGSYNANYDYTALVNKFANDVAMTVLPNAPIDDATGLPVPTIAVATNGGVSTIKDDGTVASTSRGANEVRSITFDEDHSEIFSWGTTSGFPRHITRLPIQLWGTSSTSGALWTGNYFSGGNEGAGGGAGSIQTAAGGFVTVANSGRHFGIEYGTGGNLDDRLVTFSPLNMTNNANQNLSAFITSSYNTGYMNGDIKGAFLSDTDTTNVTGGNIVTNGDTWTGASSSTSSTPPNGWTGGNAAQWRTATGGDGSYIRLVNAGSSQGGPNSYMYQAITTVPGRKYKISLTQYHHATISVYYSVGTSINGGDLVTDTWVSSSGNTPRNEHNTFTATGTTTYLTLGITSGTNNYDTGWDNVVITEIVDDHSINANGLHSFGTITKSPVANGAELVAYSGFSASNYLEQPYNSDLNFGTGDFSFISWVKHPNTFVSGQHSHIISKINPEASSQFTIQYGTNSTLYLRSNTSNYANIGALSTDIWQQIAFVRRSGVLYGYKDGNLIAYNNFTDNISNNESLRVGYRNSGYPGSWSGSLALLRVSSSAPSPEQIKKMYEDEKHLFQENAKATLYGSSDAVTALGYDEDTELLHVGTSSGRSDFQGLRRINNTTTAVTTAISASGELIAEQ